MEVELANFINMIGLDRIAPGRYSFILILHLFGGWKSGFQGPEKIIREIQALESGASTGLKAPIQNKYPPLKGLWHKHYLQDGLPSLAKNVQLALKKYGMPYFQQKIREAEEAGEERFMTAEDLMAVANDVVHGNLGRRREDEANDRRVAGVRQTRRGKLLSGHYHARCQRPSSNPSTDRHHLLPRISLSDQVVVRSMICTTTTGRRARRTRKLQAILACYRTLGLPSLQTLRSRPEGLPRHAPD